MNLQHLEYMIEIERSGSISRAAQKLYVSQPYLSKILKEVEDEYQISIFSRGKQGITLTNSGQLFIDMAKDLLDNANRFQKTFEEKQDSSRLRISTCPSSHIIDAFIRMLSALPDTDFRVSYQEGSNMDVIDDIYTHRADIGVLLLNMNNKKTILELLEIRRIAANKLFDTGTWFVAREGHPLLEKKEPLTMEDIYQYNFVLYPSHRDIKTRALESLYAEESLKLINWSRIRKVIYVNSRSALHNIIESTDYLGIGMAPVPDQEKRFHIVSIPLPKDAPQEEIRNKGNAMYYIYLKDRELSWTSKTFVDFLESSYGKESSYSGSLPGEAYR